MVDVFVSPYLPSGPVFPTTVGTRIAVSSWICRVFLAFFLHFSRGVGSHLPCWSSCAACRGSSCVVRRPLSESYAGNANIYITRNGPLHSAQTKNANKVYGTTFIQAGEEFTTYDEFCRNLVFSFFEQCAQPVRTMCFSTLSTAFALGKGSSLGLGNRPPGLTQEAKTFSTTSHNVATLQPLLWGFGDFGGPQPLARRVQAGVKNNRALPKTVR